MTAAVQQGMQQQGMQQEGMQQGVRRGFAQGVLLEAVHETRYAYSTRVEVAHHVAYLLPRATERQEVLGAELRIQPPPTQVFATVDRYENRRAVFALFAPHRELAVICRSRVRVAAGPSGGTPQPAAPPWTAVRDGLRFARGVPFDPASEFCFDSQFVARDARLRAYAEPCFAAGRTVLDGARELMRRIHSDFTYAPSSTEISTPLLDAFAQRRGVCQDFAHVMIGCMRSLGLPARYVSGYLLTRPPEGAPALVGADASHAWVAVYCPREGWIDLDPTNDRMVGTEHVTVAIGRDYGDVAPLRGVIRGGGAHTLSVAVRVTRAPAA